jgi:hypothetical protein
VIELFFRCDPEAKAELHQRSEDLRESLWSLSDQRKEEAEAERQIIIEDKCIEDHITILSSVYVAMIQAEVNLFLGNKQLVMDYYRDLQCLVSWDLSYIYGRQCSYLSLCQPLDDLPNQNQALSHLMSNLYDTNGGPASSNENLVKSVALNKRENSAGVVAQETGTKNALQGSRKPVAPSPNSMAFAKKLTQPTIQKAQPTQALPTAAIATDPNDAELNLYSEILYAYDLALTVIQAPAEVVVPQEKEKKEKKKGAAAEPNPEVKGK